MEDLLEWGCNHHIFAELIFACCILLAGLNVPLSLDITLISAGIFAALCPFVHPKIFFAFLFFSAWISAWEAYWIGRVFGPKLYDIRWFHHLLNPRKVEKLHYYYEKFGVFAFIVGRFLPGGVRNALFMTSGLGKMPFPLYISRDFPACLLSCGFLYSIGYFSAQNHHLILHYFRRYNLVALLVVVSILALYCFFCYRQGKNAIK